MISLFSKLVTNKVFISSVTTAFVCMLLSMFYVNHINTKWQNVVSSQEARIAQLEKKHNESQVQISNLSGQLLIANQETKKVEEKAKKLQHTVDQLILQYSDTDTPVTVYANPAEELQAIKVENVKMKEDIKVFIAEIKVDRELIDLQKRELNLHIKKEELMTQDIKTLEDLNDSNKKLVDDLKYKLNDETAKKKVWRTATVTTGSTLLVTILLILVL